MEKSEQVVRRLLKVAGTTYAAEAGIRLSDKPMPLFQLLVLCTCWPASQSTPQIAMGTAHELFKAGLRTPKAVLASDRRTMISAFGRAHYVRYAESSATRLTDIAERVRDEYSGDLRQIARRSEQDAAAAARMLKQFKGIGDTAAKRLGLPTEPAKLAALAPRANARLAAALVRASLGDDVRQQVSS